MSSKRRESERKANEEFDQIQQQLTRLSNEKLNLGKVKDILRKYIRERFTERFDDLNGFFTQIHQLIQQFHNNRVDELIGEASDARKILDNSSANRRDKRAVDSCERRGHQIQTTFLKALRIKGPTLRGYYLVAQGMAKTFVDISSKHISPGNNQADDLVNRRRQLATRGVSK